MPDIISFTASGLTRAALFDFGTNSGIVLLKCRLADYYNDYISLIIEN